MEQEYAICKFYKKSYGKCGAYLNVDNCLYEYQDLQNDVSQQIHAPKSENMFTEAELIASRANSILNNIDYVCSKHRNRLELRWSPNVKCYHPLHSNKRSQDTKIKSRKSLQSDLRAITCDQWKFLSNSFGEYIVPIGALLCSKCRKSSFYEEKIESIGNND